MQTRLPKTKRVWPMKIKVICTVGCLIAWGFTCKLVRGCPIVPCFEHVRAGGGGSVTIGPFICLYLWVIVSQVYGL